MKDDKNLKGLLASKDKAVLLHQTKRILNYTMIRLWETEQV